MQKYIYEKAMAPESRNGGNATLNNSNGMDNCKRKLLIFLDIFCLLLGECFYDFIFNCCNLHDCASAVYQLKI